MILGGCSCGGDIVNCGSNCVACGCEAVGKLNGCICTRCAVQCASCCICNSFEEGGCYDRLTGVTCLACAEHYRSCTVTKNTELLNPDDDDDYTVTKISAGVDSVKNLTPKNWKNDDMVMEVKARVMFKFEPYGTNKTIKFDNVRVEVTCKFGDSVVETSTRWVGSAKSGKDYDVKPTFYFNFNQKAFPDAHSPSAYTVTYKLYGEKK